MQTTIQVIYGLSDHLLTARNVNIKGFVAGAELEIEGLQDINMGSLTVNGVAITNDGSLRNSGKEFLLPPAVPKVLLELFETTHKCIAFKEGVNPFSNRTSIHVHVNCMYMTPAQVRTLLFLYAIFEDLAFSFVGQERKYNIHCVPLSYTTLPNVYRYSDITTIAGKWSKYTALNLRPLSELGTVEFRHLYGTNDPKIFATWLGFLETLWTAASSIEQFDVKYLLDLSFLRELERKLLATPFIRLAKEPIRYSLTNNLLDVKLAYLY